MRHVSCSFLVKHQIIPVTQLPYSPDLASWNLWLFPKLKSPLKGKRFQTIDNIQEDTTGQLIVIGRTVWCPKMPTLKGTEASLSHVQCFFSFLNKFYCSSRVFYFLYLFNFYLFIFWYLVSSSDTNRKCLFFILHGWIASGQTSHVHWHAWDSCRVREACNLFRATELQNKLSKLVPLFSVALIEVLSRVASFDKMNGFIRVGYEYTSPLIDFHYSIRDFTIFLELKIFYQKRA